MQSDWNFIYKLTAIRTGKSEDKYKDIGNFVFKSLYNNSKRPKSLIIKLRGIGSWYLRKSRMLATIELFPPDFDNKPLDTDFFLKILKYENKIEIFNLFKERLKEYEKYIEKRNKVREKRNETQKIIQTEGGETS